MTSRQQQTALWLIFAALVLLPVGRMVELPTFIMALGGIWVLWRERGALYSDPGQRLYAQLFFVIWVPMLISVFGAVHLSKSLNDALVFPRLYLAGVFVIWAMADEKRLHDLLRLAAFMLAFWLLDAVVQAVRGVDLFGFEYVPGRLNAVYGERHLDFGVALPMLAPLLLFALRDRPVWFLSGAVVTAAVVFLAGSRGGWVSYAVVVVGLGVYLLQKRPEWRWLLTIGLAVISLTIAVLAWQHPHTRARVETTLGLFSGELTHIDAATSGRVTIWQTALRMIADHPISGVGVGGFRYAYPSYAEPGDVLIDAEVGTGAFYAHQIVIQVLSETGLIGLASLAIFYWLWGRSWRQATPAARERMWPYALATLAWVFPLNTHASFYGAQWSQLIWLMLALYCAALSIRLSVER